MTGDGQGQVPFIAPGKFVQAGTPWWSHDGRYIAFSCDFKMARSALFTDVFIADLEKGLVRRLTGNEWHPGPVQGYGSILGVVRQWPVEQVRGIQQVNVSHQGGNGVVHKLRGVRTNEQGKEIPGEYYYAIGHVPAGKIWVKCWMSRHIGSLKIVDVLPGRETLVETMSLIEGNRLASHPSLTPDGRQLVFVRHMVSTQGFTGNLHVVNVDGSGLRQITQVAVNQCPGSPSWSPDGRRIACHLVTSRGRTLGLTDILMGNAISDIWTVGADGSNPRQLTNDGRSTDPAWGP